MYSSLLVAAMLFSQVSDPIQEDFIATVKARVAFESMDAYYTVLEDRSDDNSSCAREGRYIFRGKSIRLELDCPLTATPLPANQESLKQLAYQLSAQKKVTYDHARELYQFHNGAWTISHWYYAPTLQTPTVGAEEGQAVNNMPDGALMTPRSMIGEVGKGACDESAKTRGMSLDEFLGAPGPFVLYEDEGCRVLCHQTFFSNGVDEENLSIDLWLDKDDNLVRIDRTTRPWGVSDEAVRASIGKPWHEAKSIGFRIDLSNFVSVGERLRFPLHGVKTAYGVESDDIERLNVAQGKEKFSDEERRIRLTQLARNRLISHSVIDVDAAKSRFNIPIDESLFLAEFPQGTQIKTDARWQEMRIVGSDDTRLPWYRQYALWILGLGCCLVIVIMVPLSRKLLGWSHR